MDEPTHTTIILTRPALERLLGDDTQLEVELRHAAVRQLIEDHFGTFCRHIGITDLEHRLRKVLETLISEQVGTFKVEGWHGTRKLTLAYDIADHLRGQARRIILDEIDEIVKKEAADVLINIQNHVRREIESEVQKRVRDKLNGLLSDGG